MGTNFFHHTNACEHCGRHDERHIGKSFRMFQGYRPDPDWPDDPTPYLTSWQHWKAALLAGGEIWDEYGTRWDAEDFIARVEATEKSLRRRQYDAVAEHAKLHGIAVRNDWIDGDGFSFCDLEFS